MRLPIINHFIKTTCLTLLIIFSLLAFLTLNIQSVYSHGVDSSTYTTIILPEGESGGIKGNISFPWSLAIQLPGANLETENPSNVNFTKYASDFESEIKDNLTITNDGKECLVKVLDIPKQNSDELLFGLGVLVNIEITCSDDIGTLVLKNTFFTNLPHHTNSVTVFKGSTENLLQSSLLTPNVTSFTVGNVGEGSGDDEEKKGVGGLNKEGGTISKLTSQLTSSSLPLLLGIVFLLGFLHTLEAGHSKTILGGLMVNSMMSFKQAILYALIFTTTHIADIVILGVILLLANSFVDVYSQLPYLQQFSLYALFFISLFLVLKSVAEYIKEVIHRRKHRKESEENDHRHNHDHTHEHTHVHMKYDEKKGIGQQLLMGFVAGLAPCIFGWSIFMAILSTKSVITLFPVVLSFGLGIFLSLVLFAFIVWKLKKNIMKEGSIISDLSPILSASILLIYSLSQIV